MVFRKRTTTPHSNQYDEVFFGSYPAPERHPDRIAVIGRLHGIAAPIAASCRVLELGCSTGTNLIPLAAALPESEFLGVDHSSKQLSTAFKMVEDLGLKNIELKCSDFAELELPANSFDYVICHGVFSWVERKIQERILTLCSHVLAKQGIAYVSYNALPGWGFRGILRDSLTFADRKAESPSNRIAAARKLLAYLTESLIDDSSVHGMQLKGEIERCTRQSDAFIFHELLGTECSPLYLHSFVERAAQHSLQYLGDGRFSRVRAHRLRAPEGVALSTKPVHRAVQLEQIADVLFPKPFRGTLLCRDNLKIELAHGAIGDFFVSSPLVPLREGFDPTSERHEEFCDPREFVIEVSNPLVKSALSVLHRAWPKPIAFQVLWEEACQPLNREGDRAPALEKKDLQQALLDYFGQSLVEFSYTPPDFVPVVEERPYASLVARFQAGADGWVTSLRHEYLILNELERKLLPLLDGTRSMSALLDCLRLSVSDGSLGMKEEGAQITDPERQRALLSEQIEISLAKFAEGALLSSLRGAADPPKRAERVNPIQKKPFGRRIIDALRPRKMHGD